MKMDKQTQHYRLSQIARLNNKGFDYAPTIKIMGGYEGKTNCLSISKNEYIAICKILTENN